METLMLLMLAVGVALDGASVGQFMVSRPLVAGALAGWVVGHPESGLFIGVILELLQLPFFQIGGARVSEGGLGAVLGTAVLQTTSGPGGIALGVLLGLAIATLGGVTVEWLHRSQGRWGPWPESGRLNARRLARFQWASLGMDAARAAALAVLGLGVARLAGRVLAAGWVLDEAHTALALLAAGSFSLGAFFHNLGLGRRSLGALAIGTVLGLAFAGVIG